MPYFPGVTKKFYGWWIKKLEKLIHSFAVAENDDILRLWKMTQLK